MQNGELIPPSSWPSPPGEGGVARGHWGRFRTAQMQFAGAALGHYWGMQSAKAEGLSDRNTFFIYDTDERGSGLEEKLEENVRLCSLNRKKMFEALDGERRPILQNARQTEIGTRVTRPSEYKRQSEARKKEECRMKSIGECSGRS